MKQEEKERKEVKCWKDKKQMKESDACEGRHKGVSLICLSIHPYIR